jgi:2'-hydroxyisoflavone reductase
MNDPERTMMLRRQFIGRMAAAGAALSGWNPMMHTRSLAADLRLPPPDPLRILILGGTGLTGPAQVAYAVERGHRVTIFNRGRSRAELPAGVVNLIGDRNGQLDALREGEWDVVIDNPTTLPSWVRSAAEVLRGRVGHYVFISTISVYESHSVPDADETAPLARYSGPDRMAETMENVMRNPSLYGALKAASEQEVERWFPGESTVIRPGLIVGPRDESDRFTYWVDRMSRGGEVLAPGTGDDPVQLIDARDLAEWTIRMAESRVGGIYNATGPERPLTMREVLGALTPLASERVRLTWIPADVLEREGVQPWAHMPAWVPSIPETAGFSRISIRRALDQGLRFRPLEVTATDTLRWFRSLPAERQAAPRAGITAAREAELLDRWRRSHLR